MVRLAEEWDTAADDLAMAISIGVPQHPSEVDVLRRCAAELHSTLRAQSAGGDPAPDIDLLSDSIPDVDPLGDAVAGDPDPTRDVHAHCNAMCRYGDGRFMRCTRPPHPGQWRHIAGDGERVLAVWTDVVYLVLSDAERAEGFVRPLRASYRHIPCGSSPTMASAIAETHARGMVTIIAVAIAETFARDPGFYGNTYCAQCRLHRPVGEFEWLDGSKVGT